MVGGEAFECGDALTVVPVLLGLLRPLPDVLVTNSAVLRACVQAPVGVELSASLGTAAHVFNAVVEGGRLVIGVFEL